MVRRLVTGSAAALAACLVLCGCSAGQGPADELQVSANLSAAQPAKSPEQTRTPAGRVLPSADPASASVVAGRSLALALRGEPRVAVHDLDALRARPWTVPLPGAPGELTGTPDGRVLVPVPSADAVLIADPATRRIERVAVSGGPSSAALFGDRLLVGLPERNTLVVLRDGKRVAEITGDVRPDQVLVADGRVVVLDRLRSAVFDVRLDEQSFGAGLRADQGAVNAVPDGFGRVLVSEARVGQFFAFGTDPVLMRQRYPVSGVPYGIAFDGRQNLVWMTLTERNEVVGFDVTGGEPVERARFATVRQPDSVSVDQRNGRVLIASATQNELQVIDR